MTNAERHAIVMETKLDVLLTSIEQVIWGAQRIHIAKDNPRRPHGAGYFVPLREMKALRAILERIRTYDTTATTSHH